MATNTKAKEEIVPIDPLRPVYFGLQQHVYRLFNATAPKGLTPDDLMNPKFWTLVATQLRAGDQIRVVSVEMDYVAELFITFAEGTVVRTKVLWFKKFDESDSLKDETIANITDQFEVAQKGMLAWCVTNKETGERIKEKLPSKIEADKWLEDYVKALKS